MFIISIFFQCVSISLPLANSLTPTKGIFESISRYVLLYPLNFFFIYTCTLISFNLYLYTCCLEPHLYSYTCCFVSPLYLHVSLCFTFTYVRVLLCFSSGRLSSTKQELSPSHQKVTCSVYDITDKLPT